MRARNILSATSAALLLAATPAAAETIIGLTSANGLVTFDSATPGTVTSPVPITGLVTGDTIRGIDIRPATGQLYGLSSTGLPPNDRLYTINPSTGVATLVATLAADPADLTFPFPFITVNLTGSGNVGIDFNPVPDRLRVTNVVDQNLRINPTNGLVQLDGLLAYASGDPNAAQNPSIVGAAYINNFSGATSTVLYGIDFALDLLVTQSPPNDGVLNTRGPLGFNTGDLIGFDISGLTGTAYASLTAQTGASSQLFTINLDTGAAASVGTIAAGTTLRDIAAPIGAAPTTQVPAPAGLALLTLGAALLGLGRGRTWPRSTIG